MVACGRLTCAWLTADGPQHMQPTQASQDALDDAVPLAVLPSSSEKKCIYTHATLTLILMMTGPSWLDA